MEYFMARTISMAIGKHGWRSKTWRGVEEVAKAHSTYSQAGSTQVLSQANKQH